jgi:colanic acid/amylovoran biosynthesis protein
MNILLTGQCSLHWGRMEYGNIGNYYIFEPILIYLNSYFPNCKIYTTFQCSEKLCEIFNVCNLPLEYYYSFENPEQNLKNALIESMSSQYKLIQSKFIKCVQSADVVIQFDGDIWGDNADFIGKDRFLVGLLKSVVLQTWNKNVYMIAGSPGPFEKHNYILPMIKQIYKNFKGVSNREPISSRKLKQLNFSLTNTMTLPCPSFLFKSNSTEEKLSEIFKKEELLSISQNPQIKLVGFILCGWNMPIGPYNKKTRQNEEFTEFIKFIEDLLINCKNTHIVLISHNNAFEKEPFTLMHGRDYKIIHQLYNIIDSLGTIDTNRITLLNGVYTAHETKGIINKMDFMISGRLHGCVAALTNYIPTLMLTYDNGPPSHKLEGFSEFLELKSYISKPYYGEMKQTWELLLRNELDIRKHLKIKIPFIQKQALKNFETLYK